MKKDSINTKEDLMKVLDENQSDNERMLNIQLFAAYALRKAYIIKLGLNLPHGAKVRIARDAKVSRMTAYRFFNGETENEALLCATLKYLKSVKEMTKELSENLDS